MSNEIQSTQPGPELLPCPFCGAEPRVSVAMDESIWNHTAVPWTTIRCDSCDANSGAVCEGDETSAHERWNRRASDDEGMALARRLVAASMREFMAHHASTIQAALKILNDWNHWYGEHGANMPLPPAGIVRTQEALSEAQALVTDEMVNRFLDIGRCFSTSNDYEGGNCVRLHFNRDELIAFARAILSTNPKSEPAAASAAPEAAGKPVAWCELTAGGQIAYFDGKPMVMPGPVGNDCHPHPLYLGVAQAPAAAHEPAAQPQPMVAKQHAYTIELTDGDARKAHVVWVDRESVGGLLEHKLCVYIDQAPAAAPTAEQRAQLAANMLRFGAGMTKRMAYAIMAAVFDDKETDIADFQPAASDRDARVDELLFEIDDRIARLHGDDRGGYAPVNELRSILAAAAKEAK